MKSNGLIVVGIGFLKCAIDVVDGFLIRFRTINFIFNTVLRLDDLALFDSALQLLIIFLFSHGNLYHFYSVLECLAFFENFFIKNLQNIFVKENILFFLSHAYSVSSIIKTYMTDPNLSKKFLHACQSGDLSRVETLVSKYDIQDWTFFRHLSSGDTALHVATRAGHLNIVRYLYETFEKPDFKVDVTNKDMKTPLHEAAQFARNDIVKYLIEKGATIDALKRADWTPLMLACTKTGNDAYECVAALLKAKANPFLRNKDGWTPLHLICRSGDKDAFDLLASQFTRCIDDRTNNGRSAIHIAAFHGHEDLVDRLLALNSNFLNARDSTGSTPLHESVKGGHLIVTKRLIDLGADVNATDNVGQTILRVAAIIGNEEAVKDILEN